MRKRLALKDITVDPEIQCRVETDIGVAREYGELLREQERRQAAGEIISPDDRLPLPVVFTEDHKSFLLAEGFHRYLGAQEAGLEEIEVSVQIGDRRKAILHAAGSNYKHGLRRTNADKRRAIAKLLSDSEWQRWSDNQIAEACHVSAPTVAAVRAELNPAAPDREGAEDRTVQYKTKHGTKGKMKVGKIGRKKTHSAADGSPKEEWQRRPTEPASDWHRRLRAVPEKEQRGRKRDLKELIRRAGNAAFDEPVEWQCQPGESPAAWLKRLEAITDEAKKRKQTVFQHLLTLAQRAVEMMPDSSAGDGPVDVAASSPSASAAQDNGQAPARTEKVITDALGIVCRTQEAIEAFETLDFFEDAEKQGKALQRLIGQLAHLPGAERFCKTLACEKRGENDRAFHSRELSNALAELTHAKPYSSVCPYCHSKGKANDRSCTACDGLPYVTKSQFDKAPEDMRQAVLALAAQKEDAA